MNTKLYSYVKGVLWFILSLIVSSVNDVIAKYIGLRLHSYEVTLFRFVFGTISLLPFIIYYGSNTLKNAKPLIHFIRAILLFLGMAGWTYGVTIAPITTGTVITFTIPIFVLVLGTFFLNENIIWQRWLVTFVAFIGIIVTLNIKSNDFNLNVLVFIAAAICFAVLDVLNKRIIVEESMISMLFYSATITAFISLPFALYYWITPTIEELMILCILGIGGNLILFFILKAFTYTDATALSPYRYLELLFTGIIAYIIFGEVPSKSTLYGALIIIPSTLFIIYSEKKEFNKTIEKNLID